MFCSPRLPQIKESGESSLFSFLQMVTIKKVFEFHPTSFPFILAAGSSSPSSPNPKTFPRTLPPRATLHSSRPSPFRNDRPANAQNRPLPVRAQSPVHAWPLTRSFQSPFWCCALYTESKCVISSHKISWLGLIAGRARNQATSEYLRRSGRAKNFVTNLRANGNTAKTSTGRDTVRDVFRPGPRPPPPQGTLCFGCAGEGDPYFRSFLVCIE